MIEQIASEDAPNPVHRCLTARSARTFGVLVMLTAWFVMSNHCALLAMHGGGFDGVAVEAQKQCCHSQSAGSREKPKLPEGGCCKSLRVVPVDAGAKLVEVQEAHEAYALVWMFVCRMTLPESAAVVGLEATGPPKLLSFAESVLQRSLLSHAPPLAV